MASLEFTILMLLLCGAVACTSTPDADQTVDGAPPNSGGAGGVGGFRTNSVADEDTVQAVQVDGVWVFHYDPQLRQLALHGGVPNIVNSCLLVGDAVVLWPPEQSAVASEAVAAALAGDETALTVGGGDRDIIPAVVAQHCPDAITVWFGG